MPDSHRILLKGGTIITVDPELGDLTVGDILVEDGRIAAVAPDLGPLDAEVIDAHGMIVMPGFVDTHRHTWQAPLRNIGSDWTLGQYSAGMHRGFSTYFRPEDTYAGNLLGAAEALDSGITTLLDWSHSVETPEHSDAAISALFETGGRAVFAHACGASRWQMPSAVDHDRDILRIRDQYFSSAGQLVTLAFAARGPQFASHEVTLRDWELVREVGAPVTVHVGDGEWGKTRPVAWMNEHGLLAEDVTYVHCNTLADDELRMIADTGGSASVSADIETQMGHGWPATGRLLAVGIRPSLSIDVCTSNGGSMFGAMKTTISIQRALDNAAEPNPGEQQSLKLGCRDVIEFATLQGARAVGLGDRVGSITVGKDADIILIRTDALGMRPLNHPAGAVVYSAHAGLVDTVLVAGRVVKRGGVLTTVDAERVGKLAEETRDHLLRSAQAGDRIPDAQLGGDWLPGTVRAPSGDNDGATERSQA
ncbi:amidohydrolase family protein [Streptomyces sp. NBC_01476]|uniref:amidohydrolase family protein n=1 Tax=Streptomyces sp. NBC_01476 TaxID=2903881 RepID=UPI002E361E80|nr:amidohydrolase family protein [Streptomyces sp. NBC_01476]